MLESVIKPAKFIRDKLKEYRSRSSGGGSPDRGGSPGDEEEKQPRERRPEVGVSQFNIGQSLIPEGEGVKLLRFVAKPKKRVMRRRPGASPEGKGPVRTTKRLGATSRSPPSGTQGLNQKPQINPYFKRNKEGAVIHGPANSKRLGARPETAEVSGATVQPKQAPAHSRSRPSATRTTNGRQMRTHSTSNPEALWREFLRGGEPGSRPMTSQPANQATPRSSPSMSPTTKRARRDFLKLYKISKLDPISEQMQARRAEGSILCTTSTATVEQPALTRFSLVQDGIVVKGTDPVWRQSGMTAGAVPPKRPKRLNDYTVKRQTIRLVSNDGESQRSSELPKGRRKKRTKSSRGKSQQARPSSEPPWTQSEQSDLLEVKKLKKKKKKKKVRRSASSAVQGETGPTFASQPVPAEFRFGRKVDPKELLKRKLVGYTSVAAAFLHSLSPQSSASPKSRRKKSRSSKRRSQQE